MDYTISRNSTDGITVNDIPLSNFYSIKNVDPGKFAIKPFRIAYSFSVGNSIMRYSLRINNSYTSRSRLEIWQKVDDSNYAFLDRLYPGINHIDLPIFPDDSIQLAIVCPTSATSIDFAFDMGSRYAFNQSSNTLQPFEWNLTQATEFLAIPNMINLDQINSRLVVNGITQNDVTDYNFDGNGINWVSPDFNLGDGDLVQFYAVYTN